MFKEYPEIENTYNTKFIDRFTYLYPELLRAYYAIYEKLHGSNLQIIIPDVGDIQIGKRHSIIKPGEKFYNIWEILPRYKHAIQLLTEYARSRGFSCMNAYCEYFGGGNNQESRIQKGVIYNPLQQLRFFGVRIDGELQPPIVLEDMFDVLGLKELLVPKIGIMEGLNPALKIDVEMTTLINPSIEDNIMEGVVIQPYAAIFRNKNSKYFMLKKKSEKFQERQRKRKPRKSDSELDPETLADNKIIAKLHEFFLEYLTENRLQGVFSKLGEIQDKGEISKYIEFMMKDAIKDFEKDFGEQMDKAGYGRPERKRIYKAGKRVMEMLKNYL